MLHEIFIRLYRTVVEARIAQRATVETAKQKAIEQAARDVIAKQLASEEAGRAAEAQRCSHLASEAIRWHKAQRIHAYVAHILAQPGAYLVPEAVAWENWARGVADSFDPTVSRVTALQAQN